MNKIRPARYPKPDFMVLLAFFVGLGVLLASFVQAAESAPSGSIVQHSGGETSRPGQWLPSLWSLDLTAKLKSWKPRITVEECDDGLRLSRPFGSRGPALQLSTSIPEHAATSLRAGGDSLVGVSDDSPDAYLFLQKRW